MVECNAGTVPLVLIQVRSLYGELLLVVLLRSGIASSMTTTTKYLAVGTIMLRAAGFNVWAYQ